MPEIENQLIEALEVPGAVGGMVIDHAGGTPVATAGACTDPAESAAALSETLRAVMDGLAFSSPDGTIHVTDVIITTDHGHHVFRPLETAFGQPLFLYVHLDLERANLALALHRLREVTSALVTA